MVPRRGLFDNGAKLITPLVSTQAFEYDCPYSRNANGNEICCESSSPFNDNTVWSAGTNVRGP